MIYLDNAATTKVMPEAADGVIAGMTESFGNPSSMHKLGVNAERLVSFSQRKLLSALGDSSGRIIFTSEPPNPTTPQFSVLQKSTAGEKRES